MYRTISKIGSIAVARRLRTCLVVGRDACDVVGTVVQYLVAAGIKTETFVFQRTGHWPDVSLVDRAASVAFACSAEGVIGVGSGDILDVAKVTAAMVGAGKARGKLDVQACDFLFGMGHLAATPSASLALLFVPTAPSVAATSGRALLWYKQDLIPVAVAGPGPFSVGPGLQPREIVVDSAVMPRMEPRLNAEFALHALSVYVDSVAAAAGTPKAQMLWDDMAEGRTSCRSALEVPNDADFDAINAALLAGAAAADADANAKGGLSIVHALACVAAGSWQNLSFAAIASTLLPPVLRAHANAAASGYAVASGPDLNALAVALLRKQDASLEDLALWVERLIKIYDVPRPMLDSQASLDVAAALLAARATESPSLHWRPAPEWLLEPRTLSQIFQAALRRT